jgi:hypothetical protein
MTVLAAMQSAAIRLMGRKPGTFFGAANTFELELCDLVNEAATDIAKYQDWAALTRVAALTGDGSKTLFDLPADYDRMKVVADVQDRANWAFGYYPFGDINGFIFEESRGFNAWPGGWIIYDGQMRFSPAPTATAVAQFPYISNGWAKATDGTVKTAFDTDTDTFVLPERLLTLSLVWRWRANKKLDTTGDMEAFAKALDEYAAKDKGSTPIRRNASRSYPGGGVAWPWELGNVR